jgi:hypothetical protein
MPKPKMFKSKVESFYIIADDMGHYLAANDDPRGPLECVTTDLSKACKFYSLDGAMEHARQSMTAQVNKLNCVYGYEAMTIYCPFVVSTIHK